MESKSFLTPAQIQFSNHKRVFDSGFSLDSVWLQFPHRISWDNVIIFQLESRIVTEKQRYFCLKHDMGVWRNW